MDSFVNFQNLKSLRSAPQLILAIANAKGKVENLLLDELPKVPIATAYTQIRDAIFKPLVDDKQYE